ncbi:hypothetical protein VU08_00565 [Desulfobulbus sp. F5]|nr:hypothetical protein [Desulfobulbus sp. F5]
MKKKDCFIFILLFFVLAVYRISTNIENTVSINGSTIYSIPWSDAAGWVEGSEYIQRGETMSEFPSRRPLYPAFLSLIFACTGGTYFAAIIGQVILFSCATLICFYLIRNISEKYASAFFLSCITLWLPTTQSVFLTENLGAMLLVVSFGFLWSGIHNNRYELYGIGLFLLSLSFSVRPWAIGCLFTLPLLAFTGNDQLKNKCKNFLFFLIMILFGYVINTIALNLFATAETASNYPQTLYGLVSNTLSWGSASLDPVISKYMQTDIDSDSLNKIIYQRCWDIFTSNPLLFFHSAKTTYFLYFRWIISAFLIEKIYLYPAFMLFFAVLMQSRYKISSKVSLLFLLLSIVLFLLNAGVYIFLFLLLYGVSVSFLKRNSNIGTFIFLYLIGIITSLPIVGIDGGERVKIASDIFLFFLCSFSIQQLLHPMQYNCTVTDFSSYSRKKVLFPFSVIGSCFIIFICFPWFLHLHGKNQRKKFDVSANYLTPQQVASHLHLPSLPLSMRELDAIGKQWPAASYETVNGKKVYRLIRYTTRDTIFLKADQWVAARATEFWPMSSFDPSIARTVHTRSWCIFPNSSKESLQKFDQHHIYVLGTIIGRPRQWKYDTGYALLVEYIGVLNKNGVITWQPIASLNT